MKQGLLFAAFLLFSLSAQAQTADEIIKKHLEKMGGANWDKITSMKMEAKIVAPAAPGMEIPMTMTIVNKKAARIDVSVMGMSQTTCINGDAGWMINPFGGSTDAQPLTADQVKEMKEMTDLGGALRDYKAKGYSVEYLGTEDVEGTEAHKIKVVMSPTRTQYSLIDPETYYEIKNVTVTMVDGKEVESATMMSNFKELNGVVFPYTIEQNNPMMGATITTVTNVSINPPVDEKVFAMPGK